MWRDESGRRWCTHVAPLCSPAYELKGTRAESLSVQVCVCDFMYGLLADFVAEKTTPHKFTLATITSRLLSLFSLFFFLDQNIDLKNKHVHTFPFPSRHSENLSSPGVINILVSSFDASEGLFQSVHICRQVFEIWFWLWTNTCWSKLPSALLCYSPPRVAYLPL